MKDQDSHTKRYMDGWQPKSCGYCGKQSQNIVLLRSSADGSAVGLCSEHVHRLAGKWWQPMWVS